MRRLHFADGELTIEIGGHAIVARITPRRDVLEVHPLRGEPRASLKRVRR